MAPNEEGPSCSTCNRRREQCAYPEGSDGPSIIGAAHNEREEIQPGFGVHDLTPDGNRFESEATAMGLATRTLSDVDEPGDRFYGDSSAIAFIKHLQVSLRSDAPAPELPYETIQNTNRRAAPREVFHPTRISLDLLPPRALADHLVDCYFTKIHTLYPFIHKEAFLVAYQRTWTLDNSLGLGDSAVTGTTWYYALNIVFAMGCQFSEIVRTERQATSEAFFYRCKQALDVDYLERGDLALVQIILLMSHYL
ncbi:hypothetical protein BDV12DRAFT_195152 [Aspergillus spectabilis]